ncbi:MAG: hypothetical protein OHK0057_27530 [Thermoflexibacter sp.]
MKKFVSKLLYITEEESFVYIWLMIMGFWGGVSMALFYISSLTLFLKDFTYFAIPYGLITNGLVGFIFSYAFIQYQNRIPFARVSSFFLIIPQFFLFFYFGLYYLVNILSQEEAIDTSFISFMVFTGSNTVWAAVHMVFGGVFNRIFDVRQSKKLIWNVELGIYLGVIITLIVVATIIGRNLIPNFHIFYLLLGSAIALSFTWVSFNVIARKTAQFWVLSENDVYIRAKNNVRQLLTQRSTKLMAIFATLLSVSIILIEFFYNYTLDLLYPTDEFDLAKFLCNVSAIAFSFGLGVQLFLGKWITDKYGLQSGVLALPGLFVLCAALSWTTQELSGYEAIPGEYTLFLLTVAFGQIVNIAVQIGFHSPTFKLYFMPFDYALRLDLQPKMEIATKMIAMTITGFVMMILLWIPYIEVAHYLILLLAVAVATIWVVLKMHTEHREKIKNALTAQQQEVAAQRKLSDKTIAQELYEKIPNSTDIESFNFRMNLLEILDPVLFRARIPELLSPKKEHFQKEALILAHDFCLLEAIPILQKLIESPYFPTFKYGEMIEQIYSKLRGAEFRLERIQYIEQLTFSKIEEERIFGASLTYYAENQYKPNLLIHLLRDEKPKVKYRAIVSAAKTSATEIQGYLLENLTFTLFSNAVVSAVAATGEDLLNGLENIFSQSAMNKSLQMNVLHAYSLIGTEKVIEALWRKTESSDESIKKKAIESLSRCGVTATGKYYDIVEKQLDEACKILIWNSAALLSVPPDSQYNLLREAIKEEIASNNYWIFKYLSLMFDSNSIELVRKNIRSKKSEESEFAKELLELVLPAQFELKQYLNILLSPASEEEKLDKTQNFWPIEPMPIDDLLKELLFRDYKSVNHWTKACAMSLLAQQNKENFIPIFAAQLTNPHFMVRELAAYILHEMGKDAFEPYNARFGQEPANWLQARFQELDNLPVLKFDVATMFKNIPIFSHLEGELLSDIVLSTKLRKVYQGDIIEQKTYIQDFNYYVVYTGAVALRKGKQLVREFYEKQFVHTLDILNDKSLDYELIALNDAVIYQLKREEMNQWMLLREEVAKAFLKLIEKKERTDKV